MYDQNAILVEKGLTPINLKSVAIGEPGLHDSVLELKKNLNREWSHRVSLVSSTVDYLLLYLKCGAF